MANEKFSTSKIVPDNEILVVNLLFKNVDLSKIRISKDDQFTINVLISFSNTNVEN